LFFIYLTGTFVIEYESQEVILDLPIEPAEAGLHPPVEGGVREMSLSYDSGLENESNSTTSANENASCDSYSFLLGAVIFSLMLVAALNNIK
jgi:hypothetical protein